MTPRVPRAKLDANRLLARLTATHRIPIVEVDHVVDTVGEEEAGRVLHPGWIFAVALVVFVVGTFRLRWPLPVALLASAVAASLLAGFGIPLRHLVEGGFGYFYLVLVLFAGAFFGQAMRATGAADAVARGLERLVGPRPRVLLTLAAVLVFLPGVFVGIAGVAVLATGVFAVPLLRRLGLPDPQAAAFIALEATFGMVAPPVNLPAMLIADGVNMPFANFHRALLALSLPPAMFTVWYFARLLPRPGPIPAADAAPPEPARAFVPLAAILAFWLLIRGFPTVIPDPSTPLVLVAGTLVAFPAIARRGLVRIVHAAFSGPVLFLGAVLVTLGAAVQVMTLTGIRGFLVINAMSLPAAGVFAGVLVSVPVLGGALTAIGTAGVLGVPFAFAFIHQNMILNVSALSAVAALAEFCPPTAISVALAGYLVGESRTWPIVRAALVPLLGMAALALGMLAFAGPLGRLLT